MVNIGEYSIDAYILPCFSRGNINFRFELLAAHKLPGYNPLNEIFLGNFAYQFDTPGRVFGS